MGGNSQLRRNKWDTDRTRGSDVSKEAFQAVGIHRTFPHLAISVEAWKKSVLHPMKALPVYPETYDTGYAQWKKEAASGATAICTTSIADALAAPR